MEAKGQPESRERGRGLAGTHVTNQLARDMHKMFSMGSSGQVEDRAPGGGGIKDIRFLPVDSTTAKIQVTYKSNPTEADWIDKIIFGPCTTS